LITDNYVKQCEQAEEIQEAWKPKLGDWFYSKKIDDAVIILGFTKESRKIVDEGIYLPTLEQLWEKIKEIYFTENTELMIRNDLKRDIYSASIYTEIDDNINTENVEGKTVKECLLKLIMKEYCKIWTGEKWEDK